MINEKELKTIIYLLKRCHISQLYSIFNYMIGFIFKRKLSSDEYITFLKSINRL